MPNDLILQRRIGISEFAIGKIVLYIVMFIFWIEAPYSPMIATGMWKHLITFGCFQYRTILLSFESCKMFSIYICKIIYIFQHLSFTIIISYGLICSQYLPALPFLNFQLRQLVSVLFNPAFHPFRKGNSNYLNFMQMTSHYFPSPLEPFPAQNMHNAEIDHMHNNLGHGALAVSTASLLEKTRPEEDFDCWLVAQETPRWAFIGWPRRNV